MEYHMFNYLCFFALRNCLFFSTIYLLDLEILLSIYTSSLYSKLINIPFDVFDVSISEMMFENVLRMRYQAEIAKCQTS